MISICQYLWEKAYKCISCAWHKINCHIHRWCGFCLASWLNCDRFSAFERMRRENMFRVRCFIEFRITFIPDERIYFKHIDYKMIITITNTGQWHAISIYIAIIPKILKSYLKWHGMNCKWGVSIASANAFTSIRIRINSFAIFSILLFNTILQQWHHFNQKIPWNSNIYNLQKFGLLSSLPLWNSNEKSIGERTNICYSNSTHAPQFPSIMNFM